MGADPVIRGATTAAPQTFTCFPNLPTELRLIIWGFAAAQSPGIGYVEDFPLPLHEWHQWSRQRQFYELKRDWQLTWLQFPHQLRVHHRRPSPSLLGACVESRDIARSHRPEPRQFDPEIDTLYIERPINIFKCMLNETMETGDRVLGHFRSPLGPYAKNLSQVGRHARKARPGLPPRPGHEIVPRIRHIAVPFDYEGVIEGVHPSEYGVIEYVELLKRLPNLETINMVYPPLWHSYDFMPFYENSVVELIIAGIRPMTAKERSKGRLMWFDNKCRGLRICGDVNDHLCWIKKELIALCEKRTLSGQDFLAACLPRTRELKFGALVLASGWHGSTIEPPPVKALS